MDIKNTSDSDRNTYYHVVFASILSILAIIFSIWALCVTWPRAIGEDKSIKLGFDYLGVIVGALSVLVTVLIGMQIYNGVVLERRIKRIERRLNNEIKNIRKQKKYIDYKTSDTIGQFLYKMASYEKDKGEYELCFQNFIFSLGEYIDNPLARMDEIAIIEDGILETIENLEKQQIKIAVHEEVKERCMKIIKKYESKKSDYILSFLLNIETFK